MALGSVIDRRHCFHCGKTSAEVEFPGQRKPRHRRDRCCHCLYAPGTETIDLLALWREERARQASIPISGKWRRGG